MNYKEGCQIDQFLTILHYNAVNSDLLRRLVKYRTKLEFNVVRLLQPCHSSGDCNITSISTVFGINIVIASLGIVIAINIKYNWIHAVI